jgi:Ca-activated chloride channel homolog
VLVAIAFALAAACMVALSAQAVVSRATCSGGDTRVNVAVSEDIAPAIKMIATAFNKTDQRVSGSCARVHVTPADSSVAAAQIEGQAHVRGLAGIDAWIPDSTLWVDQAFNFAQGAMTIHATGISVAKSPLMIVTTQDVVKQVPSIRDAFAGSVSWKILLPPGFGGPPSTLGLTVELPDPTLSAVGLATDIEVSRAISTVSNSRSVITNFANDTEATEDTDSVAALANFVSTSASPDRRAVTVVSEQAVLAYDKAHTKAPLVARYPTGMSSALGTAELDYPYVLTTSSPQQQQAARDFGKFLQSGYAQSAVRYYGFRSSDGIPGAMSAATGLSSQPLQVAAPATASTAISDLDIWKKLAVGTRDIVMLDVSQAMHAPSGIPGLDLSQLLAATAQGGLKRFPASTQLGFSLIGAKGSSASQPSQLLVPIGGLTASFGLITRKQQLNNVVGELPAAPSGNLLLYDAILQAYRSMTSNYAPNDGNAVVVLTAGVDGTGDMPLSELLTKLKALYNPERKVAVVILVFSTNKKIDEAMHEIAATTGGGSYPVSNPLQVNRIFNEAWSQLLCAKGCSKP